MGYEWLFEKIDKKVKEVNEKIFKFHLTDPIVTEDLQFTYYPGQSKENPSGGLYEGHTDWNGMDVEYSTRKLSFSIQLSDHRAYTGGGLKVEIPGGYSDGREMINDERTRGIASPLRGSISFFPSFLKHEAMPVIQGERYVIVGWVHGNPFR